jgi:hypothetical protein
LCVLDLGVLDFSLCYYDGDKFANCGAPAKSYSFIPGILMNDDSSSRAVVV